MNHAEVKGHLADYLEGELSLEKRALVDSHLDDCRDCAKEVDEMQRTIRLLRMLPDPEAPPMVAANVMRRIRAGESRPSLFDRIGRTMSSVLESSFVLPASAIAVASLVVAVVQNPEFFSNLDPAGENDGFVSARTDSAAAVPIPFAAQAGSLHPQIPASSARRSIEYYPPLRIQIGGTPTPRQQAYSGLGRGPRIPEVWVTNVSESRPGNASDPATGMLVSVDGSSGLGGMAQSAMQTRSFVRRGSPVLVENAGSGDPRDEWIQHALDHPTEFARYIGSRNLAEQELWVSRLSDRADARGLMADLVRALRDSGDATAAWVADDFDSQSVTSSGSSANAD